MRNPGMSADRPGVWLVRDTGARLRVTARGVLLGRREDCDIVLNDPRASHHHALVTPTTRGLELIALGRNPTRVDGRRVDRQTLVRHGQAIEVPGGVFMVHSPFDRRHRRPEPAWVVVHPDGNCYGLRQLPFIIGGVEADDLIVEGWPAAAVCFYPVQGGMAAEFTVPATLNDDALQPGAVEVIDSDDRISIGHAHITLKDASGGGEDSTQLRPRSPHPTEVLFEFLPNGGRIHLGFAGGDRMTVSLPELRARLLATLLSPPGAYEPGEFIPDDALLSSIWPGNNSRGRTDLNVLIHRTRKSLMKAGVNPAAVLARARQGRATCFKLAPGAKVEVK